MTGRAFRCRAMDTTFELRLRTEDAAFTEQLAGQAFAELKRLEDALSRFRPGSDVARINRLANGETARVGVSAYECLRIARRVWQDTRGAFDPTVGSRPSGRGMENLEIHEDHNAVTVHADGLHVDLGGIGKGYALDTMAGLLREWDAGPGLLHGGESTILPLGRSPEEAWPVALRHPQHQGEALAELRLRRRALSGSGVGLHGDHIVDPRTGQPGTRPAAWALAGSAAVADALSTAFMVMTEHEVAQYCREHPGAGAVLAQAGEDGLTLRRFGDWP